ncbi:hypothetical protein N0V84_005772 [Fusarium piperis]|uniref:Non-reducing end beta-L-arabinofuranosidase n=1 Tax=Fusarium piperis TaxID=1435070 RepID=A0A9W9BNQ3_9HYPO|nr:hypothetical protein N0V84_005772 [Fusarium piperis]
MLYLSKEDGRFIPNAEGWHKALYRLWYNMVDKKMYMTGGIGAIKQWEGISINYFLPQGTDESSFYKETCASIAAMMLAELILHLDLEAHYTDIMELCLYNIVMTAMGLDGKAFTRINQLASTETDKSVREEWFWCACCSPNLTRLFGSLGGYLWDYGTKADDFFVNLHLYAGSELAFDANGLPVALQQRFNWPWEDKVDFQLSASSSLRVVTQLRLPAWSKGAYVLTPSPRSGTVKIEKGYICLLPAHVSENPSVLSSNPQFRASVPLT